MKEFRLFISGETARTRKTIADIESFMAAEFGGGYNLRIIDVIENPRMAQEDGILATPTLVKVNPPMKKILGDFSDMGKVLARLGIQQPSNMPDSKKK